jgi:hypothetical protein
VPDAQPRIAPEISTAPRPDAAPTRQPAQPRDTLVPWLLVGAGAAVGITGGVLIALGQSRRAKIEDAEVGTSWSDVAGYDDADTFTGLGGAALGVGVAVAVVGIVLLASDDDEEVAPAHARLLLGPGGLHLRGAL